MKSAALLAAALLTAAPAAAQAPAAPDEPKESCFRSTDMLGHRFADADTMYLRVRINDIYEVEMSGRCLAGRSSNDVLILDHAPPSGFICRPIDFNLKVAAQGAGAIASSCIVKSLRKLTPAEADALPPKLRP